MFTAPLCCVNSSSDLLSAVIDFSRGNLLRGLDKATHILSTTRGGGGDTGGDLSNLLQISEQLNRGRLYDYSLR